MKHLVKHLVESGNIKHKKSLAQVCPMSMGNPEGSKVCVGQNCMAWRWRDTSYVNIDRNEGFCGMVSSKIK